MPEERVAQKQRKGRLSFFIDFDIYIYVRHVWDIWGGFISLTSIPDISTALMRPRRPKQYCLQLYIYIYINVEVESTLA